MEKKENQKKTIKLAGVNKQKRAQQQGVTTALIKVSLVIQNFVVAKLLLFQVKVTHGKILAFAIKRE